MLPLDGAHEDHGNQGQDQTQGQEQGDFQRAAERIVERPHLRAGLDRLCDCGGHHRSQDDDPEGACFKRAVEDDLQGEEHPGDRGVKRGGDGAGRARRHQQALLLLGDVQPVPEPRSQVGPDLDAGVFRPHGCARPQRERRSQPLERHPAVGQPPARQRDRLHDARHAVVALLPDEARHDPADERPGGGQRQHDRQRPQRGGKRRLQPDGQVMEEVDPGPEQPHAQPGRQAKRGRQRE